jgi:hypothetical protein
VTSLGNQDRKQTACPPNANDCFPATHRHKPGTFTHLESSTVCKVLSAFYSGAHYDTRSPPFETLERRRWIGTPGSNPGA